MSVRIKRVYDLPEKSDGLRVLVDRIWPRGLKKECVDIWEKEVAPSSSLRKWFGHDPSRWREFKSRYRSELKDSDRFKELKAELAHHKKVTLLFGAKDEVHNNAVVLKDALTKPE